MSEAADAKLRLDKWLWYARFFKSRTLSAEAVSGGKVRVNKQPVNKPGFGIKPGDVLTFAQQRRIRVIEVVALGNPPRPAPKRRGPLPRPGSARSPPHPDAGGDRTPAHARFARPPDQKRAPRD